MEKLGNIECKCGSVNFVTSNVYMLAKVNAIEKLKYAFLSFNKKYMRKGNWNRIVIEQQRICAKCGEPLINALKPFINYERRK